VEAEEAAAATEAAPTAAKSFTATRLQMACTEALLHQLQEGCRKAAADTCASAPLYSCCYYHTAQQQLYRASLTAVAQCSSGGGSSTVQQWLLQHSGAACNNFQHAAPVHSPTTWSLKKAEDIQCDSQKRRMLHTICNLQHHMLHDFVRQTYNIIQCDIVCPEDTM
jgi:hypothetical protein